MKIIAFLITLVTDLVVAVAIFFVMMMTMNGYSESDALWGMGAYILLALIICVLASVGSVVGVNMLMKRRFSAIASVLIAVPVFSLIGAGLEVVSCIAGVAISEFVRVNHLAGVN